MKALNNKVVEQLKAMNLDSEIIASLTPAQADEYLNIDADNVQKSGSQKKSNNRTKRLETFVVDLMQKAKKDTIKIERVKLEQFLGCENYGTFFSIFVNNKQLNSNSATIESILKNIGLFRKKVSFVSIKSNQIGSNNNVDKCKAESKEELSRMQANVSIDLWFSRQSAMINDLFGNGNYSAEKNFTKIEMQGKKEDDVLTFKSV